MLGVFATLIVPVPVPTEIVAPPVGFDRFTVNVLLVAEPLGVNVTGIDCNWSPALNVRVPVALV